MLLQIKSFFIRKGDLIFILSHTRYLFKSNYANLIAFKTRFIRDDFLKERSHCNNNRNNNNKKEENKQLAYNCLLLLLLLALRQIYVFFTCYSYFRPIFPQTYDLSKILAYICACSCMLWHLLCILSCKSSGSMYKWMSRSWKVERELDEKFSSYLEMKTTTATSKKNATFQKATQD